MKKILLALAILSSISSAFSQDCVKAYEQKSDERTNLHVGLYATAIVAGGGIAIASPAGAWVFLVTFGGASLGSLAQGDLEITNQFDGIQQALLQSRDGDLNGKAFKKLAGRVKHRAFQDHNVILTIDQISAALNLANNSQAICPLVKIKRNGEEKRAVFNRKTLVLFVSELATRGAVETKIVTSEDLEIN